MMLSSNTEMVYKPRMPIDGVIQRDVERFLLRPVRVVEASGCAEWMSARSHGYGVFRLRSGRQVRTHRFALAISLGRWPSDAALHRCDNPPCINPDHLFEGSQADNMRDRDAKGRVPSGERHVCAKLTWAQVDHIRVILSTGVVTQRCVATAFGVSRSTVKDIKSGRNWSAAR